VQTKAILCRNLWNSGLITAISFWVRIALKISHTHFRMMFAPRQGGTSINESQKEDTWKKRQDVLFSENRFCYSRSGTYYALLLGYFGLKFLPDIRHCVYWTLAEVWAPNQSHKIGNKSFIRHYQGWMEVRLCVKLFDFFCGWILIHLIWNLLRSQIQWRFLGGISGKNYSGRIFQKFCANQGYHLPKLVSFRPNFCNFILGTYCTEKNSHKHFRMLFAPRQGGTSINESQKEDTGTKSQDVLFLENKFCSLSVCDLLCLTPWVFWSEVFTRHSSLCLLSFG